MPSSLLRTTALTLCVAACGTDTVRPTEAPEDLPPRIELAAPDSVYVDFHFRVDVSIRDDNALALIECDWGDDSRQWPAHYSGKDYAASPGHSYSREGDFTITVRATDSADQLAVRTRSVVARPAPPVAP